MSQLFLLLIYHLRNYLFVISTYTPGVLGKRVIGIKFHELRCMINKGNVIFTGGELKDNEGVQKVPRSFISDFKIIILVNFYVNYLQ